VKAAKRERIEGERDRLRGFRRRAISDIYDKLKGKFLGATGRNLPIPQDIYEFEPLLKLINAEFEHGLQEAEITAALTQFFHVMEERLRKTRNDLAASLPALAVPDDGKSLPAGSAGNVDRVSLVTSIFECTAKYCQRRREPLTIDSAISHECSSGWFRLTDASLVFNERGSVAAASLVTQLGLDVRAAVPADLDAASVTVKCLGCRSNRFKETQLFTWLEYVRLQS
jgi:hypothetical protein